MALYPTPHLVIDDAFDEASMSNMVRHWPEEDSFTTYSDGHNRRLGDPGRFGFYILGHTARKRAQALDNVRRAFWKGFAGGPVKDMITSLYRRFYPGLKARFGDALPQLKLETFAVLVNSYQHLDVGVHTDQPAFLFSSIIYVDDRPGEDAGTSLYEPLDRDYRHPGLAFLDREKFRKMKTVPFRSGTVLSLLCTGDSFHGVEKTPISLNNLRRTINIHVSLAPECIVDLYGRENLKGFDYPVTVDASVLETLNNWCRVRNFTSQSVDEAELAPVVKSFLYGEEQL